jgi:hypothetical protein
MNEDPTVQNHPYGYGVRADTYDARIGTENSSQERQYSRSEFLTVRPGGVLQFVAGSASSLPSLLLAPNGARRLWRARSPDLAREMAARWATEYSGGADISWIVAPFAIPDERAVLRMIQAHGLRNELNRLSGFARG